LLLFVVIFGGMHTFVQCIHAEQVEQPSGSTKSFTFNVTFEPDATQEDVFENSGVKKLIDMALEGCVTDAECRTFPLPRI